MNSIQAYKQSVIYEELGRCGFTELQTKWMTMVRNGFCTMNPAIGRWLLRSKGEDVGPATAQHTLRLNELAKMVVPERDVIKQHDAECDAKLCRWIFVAIVEKAMMKSNLG